MRSRQVRSAPLGTHQPRGLRRWWLDRSLRAKGLIVLAVPLIVLLGLTSANLVLQGDESNERNVSIIASALADAANPVLADLVNSETGVRGYGVTRNPIFLGPYNLMLTRISAERRSLREAAAVAGAGRQQREVDATAGKVLFELAQLRSAISRGTSAGSLLLALENEKTTMDLLRPPGR
jgi:CHASE3 domain sensor protein